MRKAVKSIRMKADFELSNAYVRRVAGDGTAAVADNGPLKLVRLVLKFRSALARCLQKAVYRLERPGRSVTPNLLGDRDIEWSWVASQMPSGRGEALDFGSGGSCLGLIAAQRGYKVTAVDLEPTQWPYVHPHLRFIKGDLLKLPLPAGHFDLVLNCSTVEHVGLVRRYGVAEDRSDGDLEAMARLKELMKPGGLMLVTIPVGQDALFAPLCRVYGAQRLPRLLEGYTVEKQDYWIKDNQNRWVLSTKETALSFKASAGSWNPLQNVYAPGCFALSKLGS